ncbi:MAG: hypothetical protein K2X81_24645 [Candidatus Obscuribacterales bacterium]|nr:hypothetical protein [Candidatus Obscuribacterales bacterium]
MAPNAAPNAAPNSSPNAAPSKELRKLEPSLGEFDDSADENVKPIQFAPGKQVKLTGGVIEKNLIIEWDDWHNKFAQAVAAHMFHNFIEMINMPHGATTWYHCEITADKHVKVVRILKSSGNFWYDKAVIDGVNRLENNDVLTFPKNSQRTEISTDLGIVMGGEKKGYLRFGDNEYHQFTKDPPLAETAPVSLPPEDKVEKHKGKHHNHRD